MTAKRAGAKPREGGYRPYGGVALLYESDDPEVLLVGPAGTGKSRGCLEKLHFCLKTYGGMRALLLRKTRTSLTESALVTYEDQVIAGEGVALEGPLRENRTSYVYPNGSVLVVGGIDRPTRIMSTEYDLIYVQEAIELSQGEWESLLTRLRHGRMPYQQILGDTNPASPSHWLLRRHQGGLLRIIQSRHEDNPTVTPAYLALLDRLTGARYRRLRLGEWAGEEGAVYPHFEAVYHVIPQADCAAERERLRREGVRQVLAVDFGYVNPLVLQQWIVDRDNHMFLVREHYRVGVLVEDLAREVPAWIEDWDLPCRVVADHDAEGRGTFARYSGHRPIPAYKIVADGIEAVQLRLRGRDRSTPEIRWLEDAPGVGQVELRERGAPVSCREEVEGYVWDVDGTPVKANDHAMDAMRYAVAEVDQLRHRPARMYAADWGQADGAVGAGAGMADRREAAAR